MKKIQLMLLAVMLMPVCASAQATQTWPLGKNWGINSKIPVPFNQDEFNKKFSKQISVVRATYTQQNAPASSSVQAEQKPVSLNEEDYTRCKVCHEKIVKKDAYKIAPEREWYVDKHSPCACKVYKDWASQQDMSFLDKAAKRQSCELSMDSQYATHTCSICGKPINAACGAISVWEDTEGKHYAHSDCKASQRHSAAKEKMLQQLDITEDLCKQFDQREQDRLKAQQELIKQMQEASEKLQQPQVQPVSTVTIPARPLKKVQRELNKFNYRYGKELSQAAKSQREGKQLTEKQQKLIKKFESLRNEYEQASKEAEANRKK